MSNHFSRWRLREVSLITVCCSTFVITFGVAYFVSLFHMRIIFCILYSILGCALHNRYRPLAVRGHVTNTSYKQWVGILMVPKIDRAHKCYLTPKIWEETHLGRYFMALWFFNKVVWFALAAMLEGILVPSNMVAKTTFCLYLVKCLIVTLTCAVNVTTSSFQHFPWSLRAKFVLRGEVIHSFKDHIVVTWPAMNLLIVRKWCEFEKPNHLFFCLRYDRLIDFRSKLM